MHSAGKINEAKGYDVTGYFLLCMSRLVKANIANRGLDDASERYIKKACTFVEDHYSDNITVEDISFYVGLDRTYLYRIFKKHLRMSPSQYLITYRLEKSVEMLENHELPIAEIGLGVGFHDASHFYKAFSAKYGMPPKKYRETYYRD